ncbi:unnamed protein product [Anisakis simplex]|uniref:FACT complex subunit n=1 Tax=Anisakis simplex TaxID=6269 RepID=A0A0M3JI42_ANISI|nr:unnamed protein product [Anisakis simplex]
MLVDPSKELEENYEILLVVENAIIEALKPGAKLSEVYTVGINMLKEKKASLMDHLIKNNFGLMRELWEIFRKKMGQFFADFCELAERFR